MLPSMTSAEESANDGAPRRGTLAATLPTVTASTNGGPGSCRTPGRNPGGGVLCARGPSHVSYSTSSCCSSLRVTTPGPALW